MSTTSDPGDPRLTRGADTGPVPMVEVKLCECGCGRSAPIARCSDRKRGHVKGQPLRFVSGHNPPPNKLTEEERRQGWRRSTQRYYRRLTPEKRVDLFARKESRRKDNLRRIYEYLASHPCVDCGERDPVVLEFDHVRGNKKAAVSALPSFGWVTIEMEIAKCDVRCANCHKRRTARQLGYFDYSETAC